jgi:hypothetical protein
MKGMLLLMCCYFTKESKILNDYNEMQAFLFEIEDFSTNRRFVKGTSFIGIHSEESKILGFDKQSLSRYSFEMQAFLSKSKIWGKIEIKIEDLQSSSHLSRKKGKLSFFIYFFL